MKFETAYSTFDDREHSIEDIQNIVRNDPRTFAGQYKASFLCPECHSARLKYVNDAPPYFSSYPRTVHSDDCHLKQEEFSPKSAENFVINKDNTKILERQMQSLLHSLFKPKEKITSIGFSHSHNPSATPPVIHAPHSSGSKRMGMKRIDLPFHKEDYNCYKYFYGKAKVVWKYDTEKEKYRILLHPISSNKLLGHIVITPPVYQHLLAEYKEPTEYCCGIVFAAKLYVYQKHTFFTTSLRYSKHIVITKL